MSRTRKISPDDILDAAERVVVRSGAAALSIDAVAREAGVSKSRVVYDHKTKSELLRTLVERRVKAEFSRVREFEAENAHTPHPQLFGRIASAKKTLDETERAVAVAICASMSSEEGVQDIMREWLQADFDAMSAGPRARAAKMAFLALYGFFTTEIFNFHVWSDSERQQILEDIGKVYASFPDPEPEPHISDE